MSLEAYNAAVLASTITATTAVAGLSLPNSSSLKVAVQLLENVWRLLEGNEPKNTQKAMEPKMKEFMYYCHSIYPTNPHYSIITKDKIYNFLFYIAFWGAKKKGASSNQSTAKMVENLQRVGILCKGKPRGSNSKSTN